VVGDRRGGWQTARCSMYVSPLESIVPITLPIPDPFLSPAVSAARANPARMSRMGLTSKCVRLAALDEEDRPVVLRNEQGEAIGTRVASGFLLRHDRDLYLYTCWHVVTGFDFRAPTLPRIGAQRIASLEMSLQDASPAGATLEGIGGNRRLKVSLYVEAAVPAIPMWEQYHEARSFPAIEIAGIRAPRYYDIVRLRIDEQCFFVSNELQVFSTADLWRDYIAPGDPLYVAGFPYGFASSDRHTQGILLSRHAAQVAVAGQDDGPYMDSACSPGMSGGPVMIEMGSQMFLAGIYTGSRFPDAPAERPNELTALGTFCPLAILLCGQSHMFATYPAAQNAGVFPTEG
jgi:Trypsin-like peptidase domain